tara:strand:- start:19 stop:531 length:513 start_codon:yes stop_codon:yes gene_type:complete
MFKMIVAMTKNRGIGLANAMPWHHPKDMRFFKNITYGGGNNCVIMGRNTWYSILGSNMHEPLPKRDKIILSRSGNFSGLRWDTTHAKDIDDVINHCLDAGYHENWVIGGGEVYKEFMKRDIVSSIFVTELDKDYECDVFFPEIPDKFKLLVSQQDTCKNVGLEFKYYEKI